MLRRLKSKVSTILHPSGKDEEKRPSKSFKFSQSTFFHPGYTAEPSAAGPLNPSIDWAPRRVNTSSGKARELAIPPNQPRTLPPSYDGSVTLLPRTGKVLFDDEDMGFYNPVSAELMGGFGPTQPAPNQSQPNVLGTPNFSYQPPDPSIFGDFQGANDSQANVALWPLNSNSRASTATSQSSKNGKSPWPTPPLGSSLSASTSASSSASTAKVSPIRLLGPLMSSVKASQSTAQSSSAPPVRKSTNPFVRYSPVQNSMPLTTPKVSEPAGKSAAVVNAPQPDVRYVILNLVSPPSDPLLTMCHLASANVTAGLAPPVVSLSQSSGDGLRTPLARRSALFVPTRSQERISHLSRLP